MVYILVTFVVVIIPWFAMLSMGKNKRNAVWQFLRYSSRTSSPYSSTGQGKMGDLYRFAPHPFTNWSLNPEFRNEEGNHEHTIEGFKKTQDDDSILKLAKKYPDSYKIVCIGGSTTYCGEMTAFKDTWPSKLKNKLNSGNKILVFNFGIGGWGTLQSLIRCITWFPLVKPNLLIFYQAKNDLTPLFNAVEKENEIYPDYQNVVGQFSESFVSYFPKWLIYVPLFFMIFYLTQFRRLQNQYGLLSIYRPNPCPKPDGLKRFSKDFRESVMFRVRTIFNVCHSLDCSVLYIPEIVRSSEYVGVLDSIYSDISEIIKDYDHVSWFNIKEIFPDSEKYFLDKMHFSKAGCELFAEILSLHIKKNYHLPLIK